MEYESSVNFAGPVLMVEPFCVFLLFWRPELHRKTAGSACHALAFSLSAKVNVNSVTPSWLVT